MVVAEESRGARPYGVKPRHARHRVSRKRHTATAARHGMLRFTVASRSVVEGIRVMNGPLPSVRRGKTRCSGVKTCRQACHIAEVRSPMLLRELSGVCVMLPQLSLGSTLRAQGERLLSRHVVVRIAGGNGTPPSRYRRCHGPGVRATNKPSGERVY